MGGHHSVLRNCCEVNDNYCDTLVNRCDVQHSTPEPVIDGCVHCALQDCAQVCTGQRWRQCGAGLGCRMQCGFCIPYPRGPQRRTARGQPGLQINKKDKRC